MFQRSPYPLMRLSIVLNVRYAESATQAVRARTTANSVQTTSASNCRSVAPRLDAALIAAGSDDRSVSVRAINCGDGEGSIIPHPAFERALAATWAPALGARVAL